jgi:hypothetical protein
LIFSFADTHTISDTAKSWCFAEVMNVLVTWERLQSIGRAIKLTKFLIAHHSQLQVLFVHFPTLLGRLAHHLASLVFEDHWWPERLP